MSDRLLHGEPVSDEQIQAWADEAERGYDLTKLAPPLVGVDLLREQVALLGDDRAHVHGEHPHVGHQGGRREGEPRVVWDVWGSG